MPRLFAKNTELIVFYLFFKNIDKIVDKIPYSKIIVWSIEANLQSGFPRIFTLITPFA